MKGKYFRNQPWIIGLQLLVVIIYFIYTLLNGYLLTDSDLFKLLIFLMLIDSCYLGILWVSQNRK